MKSLITFPSEKWFDMSEAVAYRCSVERVFLEISQNSHENACAIVYFLIKLKKILWHRYFHEQKKKKREPDTFSHNQNILHVINQNLNN